jgi:hypothetical protein
VDRSRIARRLGGPTVRRRRHRRVALVAVVLLVVAGVLVAVGSDDDAEPEAEAEATDAPEPTTVEGVCRASNEEIAIAQSALLRGNDAEGAVAGFLAEAFVDLARERAADIRALEPPADVLRVIDEHDRVVDAIDADPEASAAAAENPFEALNERWRTIGLPACAIDSGTVTTG